MVKVKPGRTQCHDKAMLYNSVQHQRRLFSMLDLCEVQRFARDVSEGVTGEIALFGAFSG